MLQLMSMNIKPSAHTLPRLSITTCKCRFRVTSVDKYGNTTRNVALVSISYIILYLRNKHLHDTHTDKKLKEDIKLNKQGKHPGIQLDAITGEEVADGCSCHCPEFLLLMMAEGVKPMQSSSRASPW